MDQDQHEYINDLRSKIERLEYKINRMSNLIVNETVEKHLNNLRTSLDVASKRENELNQQLFNLKQEFYIEKQTLIQKSNFYNTLVKIVEENPILEDEWIRFKTLMKLCCDAGVLEKLGDTI